MRAVSEAMSGSGVPLSIVPSGTGNLLARNLRLPLTEPAAMVRAVFDGDTVPMDVGWTELQPAGRHHRRARVRGHGRHRTRRRDDRQHQSAS